MRWYAALLLCLIANVALAQNPTCPTRPLGDNTNACASTAFVQGTLSAGIPLATNDIFVGSAGSLAVAVPLSGSCSIVASGTISCNANNLTGTTLAPGVVTSSLTTVGVVTTGRWNDTSEVIASPPSKFNPLFFGNAGTGVVHRFNRMFVGEATASSSDVGPVSTKDWLEALVTNTTGVSAFTAVDTTGQLGVVGAARTSDFRAAFGQPSGGAQGVSAFAYNDDLSTSATAATVAAGGSGYTNGAQTLTVLGGTCTVQPKFNVTVAGNAVTAVTLLNLGGSCTVAPSNPASTSGGGGSGATLTVTYVAGNPIACGSCGTAIRASGSQGLTVNQFDVDNAGAIVDVTPFSGVIAGSTIAFLTTPGVISGIASNNTSAGWVIGSSSLGTRHRKGGICLDGALDTSVGGGGDGTCVEMARNQTVTWRNAGGTIDGEVTANASGVQFPTDQAWTTFAAAPVCNNGGTPAAITLNSARRKTLGKTTFIELDFNITVLNNCTNILTITLPNTAASGAAISGRQSGGNGVVLQILSAGTTAAGGPSQAGNWGTGQAVLSGIYENQ
jgi:hypothetical protein